MAENIECSGVKDLVVEKWQLPGKKETNLNKATP